MCLFIETIRVEDGQVYNLPYHVERLNRTRAAFWKDISPIDLTGIISSQSLDRGGYIHALSNENGRFFASGYFGQN